MDGNEKRNKSTQRFWTDRDSVKVIAGAVKKIEKKKKKKKAEEEEEEERNRMTASVLKTRSKHKKVQTNA